MSSPELRAVLTTFSVPCPDTEYLRGRVRVYYNAGRVLTVLRVSRAGHADVCYYTALRQEELCYQSSHR